MCAPIPQCKSDDWKGDVMKERDVFRVILGKTQVNINLQLTRLMNGFGSK